MEGKHSNLSKLSSAGFLISLGIIFGDIGTSPLYVLKAIVGDRVISADLILGGLSCIFWTLTLQTSFKYVFVVLQADNKGEGGVFSLYSLVRKRAKWLVIPTIIGGCALIADGFLTPAISVSSAVEGLRKFDAEINTALIAICILAALFIIQQFGTNFIGKAFGPIMVLWFSTLATLGTIAIIGNPDVLVAINPYYAYNFLANYPEAFWLLGAVFLCTTGAEALYSDMGHCGRPNIRVSWIFVKTALLLNYFGQSAWVLSREGQQLSELNNPFFDIMPSWFLLYGVILATSAAVIASQALISGAYTLVSEAVRLNLWPKVKINYPSLEKGQLYVPSMNWILCFGSIAVVLIFKESKNMEAAYGLTIVIAMIMTTILMMFFLTYRSKRGFYIAMAFGVVYLIIEFSFLVANAAKFMHGGWFPFVVGSVLFTVMFAWYKARKIKNRYVRFVEVEDYYAILTDLTKDTSIAKYSSQLVYLTSANFSSEVEAKIIYSIIQKQPKRADMYWLVHVDTLDIPHAREYKADVLVPNVLTRIEFKLGFREEQRINILFRKVVEDLVKNGEVDITSRYDSLQKHKISGDFRFVVIEKTFSDAAVLPFWERIIMKYYLLLRKFSISEEKAFGLDLSYVTLEKVPLILTPTEEISLKRVY